MKNASGGSLAGVTSVSHVFHRDEAGRGLGAADRPRQEKARNNAYRARGVAPVSGERGYTYLILLIALAIVAWLARDSILQYVGTLNRSVPKAETRLPPGAQPAGDATQATPSPASPVERARNVEDVVRQHFEQAGKRSDAPR